MSRATVIPKVAEAFGTEHPFPVITAAFRPAEQVRRLGIHGPGGGPAKTGWEQARVDLIFRVSRYRLESLRVLGYTKVKLHLNGAEKSFDIDELLS